MGGIGALSGLPRFLATQETPTRGLSAPNAPEFGTDGAGTPSPPKFCRHVFLLEKLQRESNMHHHFALRFTPYFLVGENSGFMLEIL